MEQKLTDMTDHQVLYRLENLLKQIQTERIRCIEHNIETLQELQAVREELLKRMSYVESPLKVVC